MLSVKSSCAKGLQLCLGVPAAVRRATCSQMRHVHATQHKGAPQAGPACWQT